MIARVDWLERETIRERIERKFFEDLYRMLEITGQLPAPEKKKSKPRKPKGGY